MRRQGVGHRQNAAFLKRRHDVIEELRLDMLDELTTPAEVEFFSETWNSLGKIVQQARDSPAGCFNDVMSVAVYSDYANSAFGKLRQCVTFPHPISMTLRTAKRSTIHCHRSG